LYLQIVDLFHSIENEEFAVSSSAFQTLKDVLTGVKRRREEKREKRGTFLMAFDIVFSSLLLSSLLSSSSLFSSLLFFSLHTENPDCFATNIAHSEARANLFFERFHKLLLSGSLVLKRCVVVGGVVVVVVCCMVCMLCAEEVS